MTVAEVAEMRGFRERLRWLAREKQWINDRHLEVCRIPAPTFLEQRRAQWVASELAALGWDTRLDRAGNVVASLYGEPARHYVALTAHLDTVLTPRDPGDVRVDPGGKFLGPGVSDNGAGLAALLAIAAAVKSSPSVPGAAASLLLVANVGEEGEGNLNGMRHLCLHSALAGQFSAFVVLDGAATDHVTSQALGCRRFEVTFSGPGGHSWSDAGTANPVHALCRAMATFSETPLEDQPRSSVNVGLIEGGTSINSIAAGARAKVDIRAESNQRISELVELLTQSVEQAKEQENSRASAGKLHVKLKEIGNRPAGQLPEGTPILHHIRAVDASLGIRSRKDCSSTDANIPLSLGIPAVSIGAGGLGGGAHTSQEWFSPEGRDLGLRRILMLLGHLLRDVEAGDGGR